MINFLNKFLTSLKGKPEISITREVSTPSIRETCLPAGRKLMMDSLICPYCASKNFVKRGWREKKLELEESCRRVNSGTKKSPYGDSGDSGMAGQVDSSSTGTLLQVNGNVKKQFMGSGPEGDRAPGIRLDKSIPNQSGPTQGSVWHTDLQPSTLSNWLTEFKEMMPKEFLEQKFMLYNDSVTVATEVPVYLTRDDLEQYRDIENQDIENEFFEEQTKTLLTVRFKVMHLQMAWRKFGKEAGK